MKELYKVRRITISLFDRSTHEIYKEISCEFGVIKDKEGILFLETHLFKEADFSLFNYKNLGCPACARMLSFNDIVIEATYMAFVRKSTDESTVTFKCFDYITINEEDPYSAYQKNKGKDYDSSQLLRVDFWGLDLFINHPLKTQLMVADAPFDMQLARDKNKGLIYATFSYDSEVAHNTLTLELYDLFRDSLVGYLSLINGARVQIVKEYYNGYFRLYSYNRIENIYNSCYICGRAKIFYPTPILFEFDNYVRWNKLLNLNKYVHHLCTAYQVLDYEDRAFILILAFEGLSKQYIELRKNSIAKKIVSQALFEPIQTEFEYILKNHPEIDSEGAQKLKDGFNRLNDVSLATYKFRLILDDLGIKRTKKIKKLIRSVRSTLVHEARLKEYADYELLSELIIELILRLINSDIERHSRFSINVFEGEPPGLSYTEYKKEKNIVVDNDVIISEFDDRIKYRITMSKNV